MTKKSRRDGTGSVFQRTDGRWVAQVRTYDPVAGKSMKRRRYASSQKRAKELLREMRQTTPAPRLPGSDVTVAEFLRSWVANSLPVSGLAPSTIKGYIESVNGYAIPNLGHIKMHEFTPSEAEKWIARVQQQQKRDGTGPISPSTARSTYNAVTKAMKVAVRDGIIPANPLDEVARPKGAGKPVPMSTADHVDRALAAAQGKRIEPLLWVVALTGCRVGEALALRWDDVDLDNGTATIRRSGHDRDTTKTGKIRTVTLLPDVIDQLRALRRRQAEDRLLMGAGWQDHDGLLFTTGTGTPLDYRNSHRELVAVLKAAGLPTARPWHSLRHGIATRLLTNGIPMPAVSAMLGHSSIKVTVDLYGHVDPAIPADVLAAGLRTS